MPPIETIDCYQKAVYWPKTGNDDYGQAVVGSATELTVRWIDKRSEAVDPQGNSIAYDASVVVRQDVTIGGIMWLGELADLPVGTAITNLFEIRDLAKTPSITNKHMRREAMLMRFNGTLPTA